MSSTQHAHIFRRAFGNRRCLRITTSGAVRERTASGEAAPGPSSAAPRCTCCGIRADRSAAAAGINLCRKAETSSSERRSSWDTHKHTHKHTHAHNAPCDRRGGLQQPPDHSRPPGTGHSDPAAEKTRSESQENLTSFSILDKHATFTNADGRVTLVPHDKCKVVVNGVTITGKTELQHSDRVILGSNSTYLYVGPPAQRTEEDLSRYDYDFFQSELAAAEGFGVDKLGTVSTGQDRADPSVLAVFHDYIKLMPLVEEVNQMSQELRKDLKFELKVKNLALSDSRGHDLQKEITVKVTHETTQQVWVWSKAKFINRKFLMEELYQRFLEGENPAVNQDSDPFWDPVEAVHVGSAHVWLQALAYRMRLEERAELLNSEGLEEAVLLINLSPCFSDGRLFGEDEMVIDPLELLERRVDFQIHIAECLGVKWLRGAVGRGIQIGYRVYDLPRYLYTRPVWESVNPKIEETVHFSALKASYEFLNYLQKNALIVDLWGLQEGCMEMDSSLDGLLLTAEGTVVIDNPKDLTASNAGLDAAMEVPELYRKLLQMEQETELLRELDRALREENALLKDKLKKWDAGHHEKKKSESPTKEIKVMKQSESSRDAEEMCSHRTSCDAELAKALKTFYQNMSVVRQQFLQLKHSRPPVSPFIAIV
ncbi:kinesin-like protein KIF28P [Meleagris gallopavo]|uniref:kinesin-like protein KIF28P n=1 Tax=Meleagris gallopavo TaxID=9103 RepID=UPI000549CDF6|nr:kinesin-like protein KIF28P [Meleagris gallopavo]